MEKGEDRKMRGVQRGEQEDERCTEGRGGEGRSNQKGRNGEERGDARKERKGENEEKMYCGTYVQ